MLEDTYRKLQQLALSQDEMLRQALRCVENELYRAAHVMAWAGFMDVLEEKMGSDGLKKLAACRPGWKSKTMADLREQIAEYQLVEAARDMGLCHKSEMKSLHGLLSTRNECAHPSDYYPGLNESLGYVSNLLGRIAAVQSRKL